MYTSSLLMSDKYNTIPIHSGLILYKLQVLQMKIMKTARISQPPYPPFMIFLHNTWGQAPTPPLVIQTYCEDPVHHYQVPGRQYSYLACIRLQKQGKDLVWWLLTSCNTTLLKSHLPRPACIYYCYILSQKLNYTDQQVYMEVAILFL